LLLPRLVVEAARAVHRSPLATGLLRAGSVAVGVLLACAALNLTGVTSGFMPRWNAILAGTERPSTGAPYRYSFPRGGDIKITPEEVSLVEAIRDHSAPNEGLFQRVAFIEGGELYFFADRRDPTRFDVLSEFLTFDRQTMAFEELQADPPKLVAGDDYGVTGDAVNRFLKERYRPLGKFGGVDLYVRID
jgi:hypothetical protein